MCKLRGISWCIIHANRMSLKIWPHLTFLPFINIFLTIHPTLYILWSLYNLTSNSTYVKGHLKPFEILTPTWPLRDPYWEGVKSSKMLSKYFLTYNDSKTTKNSFSSKWHLSTFSTTFSIVLIIENCSTIKIQTSWTTKPYENVSLKITLKNWYPEIHTEK